MSTPGPSSTPLPARSLHRQRVLEEDEYTAALSQIIARDFFPSLVHLDATNEYLDAINSQDPHLLNASVRRLQEVNATPAMRRGGPWQTPSQTPFGLGPSDTPLRSPSGQAPAKRPRYDTEMSLDMFQARYTSEDNASFTQILDDENRIRREKWGWAWDAQNRVGQQIEKMIEGRKKMLIEPPPAPGVREKFVIEAPAVAGLITEAGEISTKSTDEDETDSSQKDLAVIQQNDAEVEVMDVLAPKRDTRSAGVDGWKFKTRNSLMFPPDADVKPYETFASADTSGVAPRIIKHGNTRLPEHDAADAQVRAMSAPPSPTRSRIEAAITGTPYRPRSPSTNNFSLVSNLPSPTPSEMGPAAVKQLMTWGTLNATPRILSGSGDSVEPIPTPNTPFHMPPPSNRETISHKLSAAASKSLRTKAGLLASTRGGLTPTRTAGVGKSGTMGPPTWTPRRAEAPGNLTPAAKRLLDRTSMGTAAARRAEAMGRMAGWEMGKDKDLNRVRWTPTPSPVARRG
ncbi:nuclear protein DGCR14 [Hygrophoropsis aurantiaca]|uniref:Nuclear protein DGCR14 n=1 Tax=Hygrophoropsis aurantiaca TaxID=72124 RepID=A0ACB8AHA5_9AGAM|nr:nuclear protein DGCR14 [Hygrophoropsis aurantiaca]